MNGGIEPPVRRRLLLLGVLFVLSGADALVVEQIFEKLLTTVVGSAVESGAIVLAVFFGGLFTGGVMYPRLARRVRNPYFLYAALEVVVGIAAIVLALGFTPIQTASSQVVHLAGGHRLLVFSARIGVACAWMLPPTVAMGATYPCVVRMLGALTPGRLGRSMSAFYALNLFGAVGSAALCPYFLFPIFGLGGVLRGAAAVQLAVAGVAFALGRAHALAPGHEPTEERAEQSVAPGPKPAAGAMRLLLAASWLSGLVIFSMEVLWLHLIGATVGMSAYSFGLMLAVVLLGLFVGSTLVSFVPKDHFAARALLPLALAAATGALAATQGLWDDAPRWLADCATGYSEFPCGGAIAGFASGERLRLRIVMLLVGLPAVPLGMVYPSILRTLPHDDADRRAGLLGAANALGSIAGALVTSFVLVPALGAERSAKIIAAIPAVIGALGCLGFFGQGAPSRVATAAMLAVDVACVVFALLGSPPWDRLSLTSGTNVYFRTHHVTRGSVLDFWHEDASGGFVTVVRRTVGAETVKTLLTNGKFQGNDAGEVAAQVAIALLPCAATDRRERALVIGLGTGQSAEVVHAAGFASVDIAEISRGIAIAAREHFAHVNRGVLDAPGVTLFLEDGRNHLVRSGDRYDLVTMELSSVWFAGVGNLYSREFYALTSNRMRPGAVLQQWIQLHHVTVGEVASVVATVRAVFPEVELWFVGEQGIILASDRPLGVTSERLERLAALPGLRPHLVALTRLGGLTPDVLARKLLLSSDDVNAVAAWAAVHGVPHNTDTNRFLEYATPRHALDRSLSAKRTATDLAGLLPEERRDARLSSLSLR